MNPIELQTTAETREQAEGIAKALVESRLAACVQITSISSHYEWKGRAESSEEFLLTAKTSEAKFTECEAKIKEMHSYEVPEIIALPIVQSSADYLNWMKEVIK